jgi:hypothetical protein
LIDLPLECGQIRGSGFAEAVERGLELPADLIKFRVGQRDVCGQREPLVCEDRCVERCEGGTLSARSSSAPLLASAN